MSAIYVKMFVLGTNNEFDEEMKFKRDVITYY